MTARRFTLLDAVTGVMAAVILGLALWVLTQGPSGPIPMQFGLDGEPTRWGDRRELGGLLVFMAAMVLITAGMMGWYAEKSDDPARRRGLRTGQAVSLLAIGGTTAIVVWTLLGHAAGQTPAPAGWTVTLTGLILTVIGAGLGRVAPNPIIGVRTPWAYKSRLAWDRSNRLAGRLFFWIGLGLLLLGLIAPQSVGMTAVVVLVPIAALWSVFESWRVWRADPDRQPF